MPGLNERHLQPGVGGRGVRILGMFHLWELYL